MLDSVPPNYGSALRKPRVYPFYTIAFWHVPRQACAVHFDDPVRLSIEAPRAKLCCGGSAGVISMRSGRATGVAEARTMLWRMWHHEDGCLEGVHAKLWDELLLRRAPVLTEYWRLRDRGELGRMRAYLSSDGTANGQGGMDGSALLDVRSRITNACFYEATAGAHSHLSFRFSDLFSGTEGGCSVALDLLDDETAASPPTPAMQGPCVGLQAPLARNQAH